MDDFTCTVITTKGNVTGLESALPKMLPTGTFQGMIHLPEGDHPCKIISRPTYLRVATHADYCTATHRDTFACTCPMD